MVLRIHPPPPHYDDPWASSSDSSGYSSQHHVEVWIPAPPATAQWEVANSKQADGRCTGGSRLETVHLLSPSSLSVLLENYSALFLTLPIWIDIYVFKFCLGKDVWE